VCEPDTSRIAQSDSSLDSFPRRNRQLADLRLAHIAPSTLLDCNSRAPFELEPVPASLPLLPCQEDQASPRDREDPLGQADQAGQLRRQHLEDLEVPGRP